MHTKFESDMLTKFVAVSPGSLVGRIVCCSSGMKKKAKERQEEAIIVKSCEQKQR